MFYVLNERRTLEPYKPSHIFDRVSALERISANHAIEKQAIPTFGASELEQPKADLKNSKREGSPKRHLPKGYEDQIEDSALSHPLVVEAIMSRSPMTVLENATSDDIKNLMRKTQYRHFPVMSAEGSLVGIVSDRDLCLNSESRISEVMTKKVITVDPKAPLREVVALMLHEKLPCLPVIDSTHAIVGIVTSTDILKTFLTHPPVEIWR